MTKNELRILYKEKRRTITTRQQLIWDDLILLNFQKIDFSNVKLIFSFLPIESLHEPDTYNLTRYLTHMLPDIQISYPIINSATQEMDAMIVNDDTNFIAGKLGITEPEDGTIAQPFDIDLALIPLLIFDTSGYRVGYGKGFYDRFLKKCKADILKVGICYFQPVNKIDDTNQFDVPLNYCVTPESIYEF